MMDRKREIISKALLLEDISDYAVFVRYSGHVKKIEVSVSSSKEDYNDKIFRGEFYTNEDIDESGYFEIIGFLQNAIDEVTAIR